MIPAITPQHVETGLSAVRKIADIWAAAKPESLVDYTKQLRVEPLTLVDKELTASEATPQVLQSLLAIFSGYYLQAVSISCNVGQIQIGRHLDQFSPNRKVSDSLKKMGKVAIGMEDFKDALPVPALEDGDLSLEALDDHVPLPVRRRVEKRRDEVKEAEERARRGSGTNHEHDKLQQKSIETSIKEIHELTNLSVGKLLNVTLSDGQRAATIPIAVRLMVNSVPSASLVHILSHGAGDTTVKERWHAWKAGRLEFIRDLILCQDLIDERRRHLMQDKDGAYSVLTNRKKNGLATGFLTGQPSIGMASNLVVISKNTADTLEVQTHQQLRVFAQREKIFQETAMMILVVVEPDTEMCTFYTRGIALPTVVGIRDLKASNKGNGPDVSDILRAYQLGSSSPL